MYCPDCGYENRPGARFCASCQTPLDASAAAWRGPLKTDEITFFRSIMLIIAKAPPVRMLKDTNRFEIHRAYRKIKTVSKPQAR